MYTGVIVCVVSTSSCTILYCSRGWPQPVLLRKMDDDVLDLKLQQWDPKVYTEHILYHVHLPGMQEVVGSNPT